MQRKPTLKLECKIGNASNAVQPCTHSSTSDIYELTKQNRKSRIYLCTRLTTSAVCSPTTSQPTSVRHGLEYTNKTRTRSITQTLTTARSGKEHWWTRSGPTQRPRSDHTQTHSTTAAIET